MAGKPQINVFAESQPDDGFVSVEPDLEDVYFLQIRNANRAAINGARVSRIRTFIKAVESALATGKKADAAEALKKVQPELARGVARGVIHKNTAARKISRLSKRVASLG